MAFSQPPEKRGNILPELEAYAETALYRRVADSHDEQLAAEAIEAERGRVLRAALENVVSVKDLYPAAMIVEPGRAGGSQLWHADEPHLVIASSSEPLLTLFITGPYESQTEGEDPRDFSARIDGLLVEGVLTPFKGIEPGDVMVSIGEYESGLHRAVCNATGAPLLRGIVSAIADE